MVPTSIPKSPSYSIRVKVDGPQLGDNVRGNVRGGDRPSAGSTSARVMSLASCYLVLFTQSLMPTSYCLLLPLNNSCNALYSIMIVHREDVIWQTGQLQLIFLERPMLDWLSRRLGIPAKTVRYPFTVSVVDDYSADPWSIHLHGVASPCC